MMNLMKFGDYQATIAYDPEIELFRGEFVGLNGGADFYAADIEGLRREGETSLRVFLDACARRRIEPRAASEPFGVSGVAEPRASMADEGRAAMQAFFDDYIDEGFRKGLPTGIQQGEAAVLLRLIERKFGPPEAAVRERVTGADSETLLLWSERVLTAESLDAVLH